MLSALLNKTFLSLLLLKLKKSQQEERLAAEKKYLTTEADLVASKKMVEELKRSIEAKDLTASINQRELNTLHSNTIRVSKCNILYILRET